MDQAIPERTGENPAKPVTPPLLTAPIIVKLGRQSAKQVKRLANGKGKLLTKLTESLQRLQAQGTISKQAQPIVVIVKEKRGFSLFG